MQLAFDFEKRASCKENYRGERKRYAAIRRGPLRIAAYLLLSAVKKTPQKRGQLILKENIKFLAVH